MMAPIPDKSYLLKQGYVPATCLLLDNLLFLVYSEIVCGRDPCSGCNHDREVCKGRPKGGTLQATAAAVSAAARGDFANAMTAGLPGGIEAQEAQGQKDLCSSHRLPTDAPWDKLEELGVRRGPGMDDLFCLAVLPEGWKLVPTEHSMWSALKNAEGKTIADVFYKAAFYDRRAFLRLVEVKG